MEKNFFYDTIVALSGQLICLVWFLEISELCKAVLLELCLAAIAVFSLLGLISPHF